MGTECAEAAVTPTLSPRALLREAVSLRLAADPALTHQVVAERAGMPRPRVSEALSETRGCPMCAIVTASHTRCGTCHGTGRIVAGEPRPETVAKILEALGFGLTLVDTREGTT